MDPEKTEVYRDVCMGFKGQLSQKLKTRDVS